MNNPLRTQRLPGIGQALFAGISAKLKWDSTGILAFFHEKKRFQRKNMKFFKNDVAKRAENRYNRV
ncbi:MAG: hypothetical protein LUD79_05470 [Oscillospiraceae bacterium]|nr:hypothetical protein [Oscillospiraceae bacterium]